MRKVIFCIALIFPFRIFSQHIDSIERSQLDPTLQSDFVSGYHWTDKQGDNYLILSQTKPFEKVKNSQMRFVELRAVNFKSLEKSKREITWEYNDSQKNCFKDNDLLVKFITESFSITDLNNNGICEVWIMYKMSCRTDISPAKMMLIMHEGKKEYVISGHNKVGHTNGSHLGGEHELDNNFKAAPEEFKAHGLELWEKFIVEDFK